ncbi:MAG: PilW family protein [Nitrospirae bacterium]|nr:PilW family protein [Nitrospirota bacterium]
MTGKQDGFSLVELMITVAIFSFAIAAATGIFIPLVNQFKQQSRIAETSIEGIVGLDLLRTDLEQAGYGLPWYFPGDTIVYNEAAAAPATDFNDNGTADKAPRAILSGNNKSYPGIAKDSDYLVIKSAVVARSETAQRWTYIVNESVPTPRTWGSEDLTYGTDRVIVVRPRVGDTRMRELVMDGNTFYTIAAASFPAAFSPAQEMEAYLIYGIDPDTNLRMPFNRADYYVSIPAALPGRCAPGTGVLVKAVLSHAGGTFPPENVTSLLDCVANMQVIYELDTDADGAIDSASEDISLLSAEEIRNQLVEVRIYILAHEGQLDPGYRFANFTGAATCPTCVRVGDDSGLGKDFDVSTITDYQRYRWKLYTLVAQLRNLK